MLSCFAPGKNFRPLYVRSQFFSGLGGELGQLFHQVLGHQRGDLLVELFEMGFDRLLGSGVLEALPLPGLQTESSWRRGPKDP